MVPPMLALWGWVIVTVILFRMLRPAQALVACLLGAYLLLPTRTGFDLPLLPALNKHSLPAIAAAVMTMIVATGASRPRPAGAGNGSQILPGWIPGNIWIRLLFLVAVLSVGLSALVNDDTLVYGPTVRRGLGPYDAGSMVLAIAVTLLPFVLARRLLADEAGRRVLLWGICLSASAYAALALFEVRMSPQLNMMVYGFNPASWIQHLRGGGYRPLVFLEHGLRLGIFLTMAVLIACGLSRTDRRHRLPCLLAAGWLFGTLVLAKTVGALSIALLLIPVALFLGTRLQIIAAAVLAGTVLFYPLLRSADLIPTERVLGLFEKYSNEDRVGSLKYRLKNEDILLDKAMQRPALGWSSFARNRVFDPKTGRDISVTDGIWAIVIGENGLIGYMAQFGLLTVPILLLVRRPRQVEPSTALLALALAANLADIIPNSSLTPVTWLIAGALAGRLEQARIAVPAATGTASDPPARDRPSRLRGGQAADGNPPLPAMRVTPYTRQTTLHSRSRRG
ncbi:hypothetical protein [Rhodovulum sp. MB263]|uniref:hypothetical protein n=1 Tax=Rhodovulum sp. (strain MB263) TaxID=308754 RepID=UPI0009B7416D|nr:hypothetical protein [Rhodovulum sp. MB263]ARC90811.1 hypothetical protein B5V46_19200 [Rhodovulum sp. MB263]